MKKNIEKFIFGLLALSVVLQAGAGEQSTAESEKDVIDQTLNTRVRIIKQKEYTKVEKVQQTSIDPMVLTMEGRVGGQVTRTEITDRKAPISQSLSGGIALAGSSKKANVKPADVETHQYADLYLDTNKNAWNVEGIATVCTDCPDVKMDLEEWCGGLKQNKWGNIETRGQDWDTNLESIIKLGEDHNCGHKHDVKISWRSRGNVLKRLKDREK